MIDVGRRVRDYEIVAHLKHGGMAQLFLARRVGPQGFARPVAIKVVHPHMVSEDLVRMFLDEARLSASIQHPNVVHVEELGEVEGTFFLAMEYLHGDSLSSLLAALSRVERTLPIEAAVWIASSAAAGLHAAHETCDADGRALGVVHRDVSPQNVLVSIDGHVKLIDFGVAKMRTAVATEAGMIKGKLAYMSPEQARGEAIDRRTDVYALGIVLWEMLTMRRLFAAENDVLVFDRVINPTVRPPSAIVPGIPVALDAIVLRALSRDPSARYSSAEQLQRELARAMPEAAAAGGHTLAKIVREVLGDRLQALKRELGAPSSGAAVPIAEPEEATVVTETVAHAEPSLAVMPFRVIAASDPSIGEWLADDLRDVLSRVRGLRVKARLAPRGSSEDASTYGERSGVELVVTGRVQQDAQRVRLAVALTGVDDGFQRWADRFECSMEGVLDASDRVGRAIVDAIGASRLRGDARGSADPEVIQLYGQIRQLATQAGLAPTFRYEVIDRALEIAPRDPSILSVAAMCLAREMFRPETPVARLAKAKEIAERAIELAPELPEPWMAMGHVRYALCEPTAGAVRALRRAVASGPSVVDAHDLLGRILSEAGMRQDARRYLDHALWLDPNLAVAIGEVVRLHAFAGEWDLAARALERLRTVSPARHIALSMRKAMWAGRVLSEYSIEQSSPHMNPLLMPGLRVAQTGRVMPEDIAAFRAYADQYPAGSRPRRFFRQMTVELHAYGGDREGAIAAMRDAVADGVEDLAWLEGCPLLYELRDEPAIADAVRTIRERAAEVRRAYDEW